MSEPSDLKYYANSNDDVRLQAELARYKREAEKIPDICQFAPCEPGVCGITICPNWRDANAKS